MGVDMSCHFYPEHGYGSGWIQHIWSIVIANCNYFVVIDECMIEDINFCTNFLCGCIIFTWVHFISFNAKEKTSTEC